MSAVDNHIKQAWGEDTELSEARAFWLKKGSSAEQELVRRTEAVVTSAKKGFAGGIRPSRRRQAETASSDESVIHPIRKTPVIPSSQEHC